MILWCVHLALPVTLEDRAGPAFDYVTESIYRRGAASIIHVLIIRTALIMLAQIKLPGQSVHVLSPGLAFQPNGALLIISSYTAYYCLLEPFAAVSTSPLEYHCQDAQGVGTQSSCNYSGNR